MLTIQEQNFQLSNQSRSYRIGIGRISIMTKWFNWKYMMKRNNQKWKTTWNYESWISSRRYYQLNQFSYSQSVFIDVVINTYNHSIVEWKSDTINPLSTGLFLNNKNYHQASISFWAKDRICVGSFRKTSSI